MRGARDQPAAYRIRHRDVLPHRHGRSQFESCTIRRRAVWTARSRRFEPPGNVSPDPSQRIWQGGQAAHTAGHVCVERGVLRCVLPEGIKSAYADAEGFSKSIRASGCHSHADIADSCIQDWGEDWRSAVDVSVGYLYNPFEPGGTSRDLRSVRKEFSKSAGRHATDGESL